MSTAKLRAEVEKLKLQVAALTNGPREVIRLIGDEPAPEDSDSILIIRRELVEPKLASYEQNHRIYPEEMADLCHLLLTKGIFR